MDNFGLDVVATGRDSLALALRLAFRHNAPGGKAEWWIAADADNSRPGESHGDELRVPTLVLLWSKETHGRGAGCYPFPFKVDVERAVDFAWSWLEQNPMTGHGPDHDGDNGQAFRVFVEGWGHVFGMHYAIAGIQPAWAMYGK